ncbi:MAG: zinc-binding alcohol dehydrogenase, partial [Syntrophales bacterium LBB04]|nr:zinc-binding alcohol dehydrogenase [Syntrophales bacterium LBB04]
EVVEMGPGLQAEWLGRRVFAFHPHESHFVAAVDEVQIVPNDLSVEDALFFPNMETALTLAHDGKGAIGEQVAVFGQGIVGLLLTALLAKLPLTSLVTFDTFAMRRRASIDLGSHYAVDPASPGSMQQAISLLHGGRAYRGADLTYEVSGNPDALDQALAITGYSGRVVIGSWYGSKRVSLDLGGAFHRSRIRLISSQVSTVDPELRGRWSKDRLRNLSWDMLKEVRPARLVSHHFHLSDARKAYELIDREPGAALQVVFDY